MTTKAFQRLFLASIVALFILSLPAAGLAAHLRLHPGGTRRRRDGALGDRRTPCAGARRRRGAESCTGLRSLPGISEERVA